MTIYVSENVNKFLSVVAKITKIWFVFFNLVIVQFAESGGIPLRVLRQTLVQAEDDDIPSDRLEVLLQKYDTDRDGVLDWEEFVKLVSRS